MIDINKLLTGERTELVHIKQDVDSNFVKRFRQEHSMTQAELAFTLGVTKKAVEKWEQGINKVSGSSAVLLSLLNKNPDIINQIYTVRHYKAGEKSEHSNAPVFVVKHNITQTNIAPNISKAEI